jgi:hypothetical protein
MPVSARSHAALATLLLLAPGAPSTGAPPGGQLEPGQRTDAAPLVVEKDGNWTLDQFEACGPRDGAATLQVLTHGEAPVAEIDRERFVAAVSRASWVRINELSAVPPLRCREVEAPIGDVDHEIDVRVTANGVEVASVDVAARNATRAASYHTRQLRRNSPLSEPAPGSCASTVMGQTFCAHSPQGVAVTTTMGEVVCARGDCARQSNGRWYCARRAGGQAQITPTGPACDGGCYAPSAQQCRMV